MSEITPEQLDKMEHDSKITKILIDESGWQLSQTMVYPLLEANLRLVAALREAWAEIDEYKRKIDKAYRSLRFDAWDAANASDEATGGGG